MTIEARRGDAAMEPHQRRLASGPPLRGALVLAETERVIATQLMADAAEVGIKTVWCRDGAEALFAVGAESPNVLVIAARTGTVDAAAITTTVRSRSDVPILIGAGVGEDDLTRGAMAAGASAVIARPYDIAAIAPFVYQNDGAHEPAIFTAGPIRVDRYRYETRVHGRDVQLTQRELELLVFLIEQRGKVASTDEISLAVWGHLADTNTVAVHVRRLRNKLGSDPEHGEFIRTIRGVGYRLAPSICA